MLCENCFSSRESPRLLNKYSEYEPWLCSVVVFGHRTAIVLVKKNLIKSPQCIKMKVQLTPYIILCYELDFMKSYNSYRHRYTYTCLYTQVRTVREKRSSLVKYNRMQNRIK